MNSVIKIENLGVEFDGFHAVQNLSLEINDQSLLCIIGPNGAGKSTLLKLCLGLIRPSSGTLSVLGCDPCEGGFDEVKRLIGFLPEQVMFQASLTGLETMRFYARLKGADVWFWWKLRGWLSEDTPKGWFAHFY